MDNNFPFPGQFDPNALTAENTMVSTAEDEAEKKRKELSYKRTTILLIVIAVIITAFIIWEIVDISLGGRP
ncbi:MAG: hypothetical protein K6E59_04510 [Bacilli bacterium]|nr:hypothetical protein [Bacilli bacterium]